MSLQDWWKKRSKQKSVRQYATIVRRRLFELYGPSQTYSPGRVRRAVEESGAPQQHMMLAYAMYCTPGPFAEAQAAAGWDPSTLPSLSDPRQGITNAARQPTGVTRAAVTAGAAVVDSNDARHRPRACNEPPN